MRQRYEQCVLGVDGRCHRWSHDHDDDDDAEFGSVRDFVEMAGDWLAADDEASDPS